MHNPLTRQHITLGSAAASSEAPGVPNMKDPAWAAWQAHVDAGRIGSAASGTFEQRLRLIQQEKALFGRVVTRELLEF